MRTKTLLLSALACAAGVSAASAQVYSVNAVGYVNVNAAPGFSMIANQLLTVNNTLTDILPSPPAGTQVFAWNGTGFDIYEAVDVGGPIIWAPNGDLALQVGSGVFVKNPTATDLTITFVGEVPQQADSNVVIPAGFSIVSSSVPVSGNVVDSATGMGFPTTAGDQIFQWTGTGYDIFEAVDVGGPVIWAPSEPIVEVGESFFVNKTSETTWTRNFNVNG